MNAQKEPRTVRFRREREREWAELDRLTQLAMRRSVAALRIEDLEHLPVLYRAALSSLAVARKTAMDRNLVAYLESLCTRAHVVLYGARPTPRGRVVRFVRDDIPKAILRMLPELGLSTALFAVAVAVGFVLVTLDSDWYYTFMGADMASGRDPSASTEALRNTIYGTQHGGLANFAAFLFTHNARISMLAFALGFAAGVPTALLVFTNGLSIGAFIALFHSRGMLVPVLGWLLPHGVPEISAILLCGAAGFHIGRAVVLPGELTVESALMLAGRRAAVVVLGAVILLAYAGLIEGIFRQTVTDDGTRFLLAAFNVAWMSAWIFVLPFILGDGVPGNDVRGDAQPLSEAAQTPGARP
jgi:uncharacterized membrane protein SpoIIM required for sporulation